MITEIFIIILLLGVLLYLIITTLQKKSPARDDGEDFLEIAEKTTQCPLCGRDLYRGERVHSVVYDQGEDRLMNIYGCPWCYKDHPAGHKSPLRNRSCPSCGSPLREGSFAIARVFERPGKKVHVHVLGCPACRSRK